MYGSQLNSVGIYIYINQNTYVKYLKGKPYIKDIKTL